MQMLIVLDHWEQNGQLSYLNSGGTFCMLLQHVWQSVYNRISRTLNIIVCIYFHMYNQILVGGRFAACYIGCSLDFRHRYNFI